VRHRKRVTEISRGEVHEKLPIVRVIFCDGSTISLMPAALWRGRATVRSVLESVSRLVSEGIDGALRWSGDAWEGEEPFSERTLRRWLGLVRSRVLSGSLSWLALRLGLTPRRHEATPVDAVAVGAAGEAKPAIVATIPRDPSRPRLPRRQRPDRPARRIENRDAHRTRRRGLQMESSLLAERIRGRPRGAIDRVRDAADVDRLLAHDGEVRGRKADVDRRGRQAVAGRKIEDVNAGGGHLPVGEKSLVRWRVTLDVGDQSRRGVERAQHAARHA
jgi:hypothetical protein